MRLLLVEDDAMIGKYLCRGLEVAGFRVDWVEQARSARLAVAATAYPAMVLDLGLPDGDGLDLLAVLRAGGDECAILILTARDALPDRIGGLNAGADDYLGKPFDLAELVARLHAMIRRRAGRAHPRQVVGSLVIDPLLRQVTIHGRAVELSGREFDVLQALARRPGAVLSRQALEEAIYGWDEEPASNAVEVHVHHLRRKLGPDLITNIRGVGYRLAD